MKTNNKTDNSKLFWGVFLLLFIFGMIFLSTLFLFGKSEYLTLGVVAQLMILGNLFLDEDRRILVTGTVTPAYSATQSGSKINHKNNTRGRSSHVHFYPLCLEISVSETYRLRLWREHLFRVNGLF